MISLYQNLLELYLDRKTVSQKFLPAIGLFGLIASFHSIIIGYSRQIFALWTKWLFTGHAIKSSFKNKNTHWALLVGGIIGIIAVISGTTNELIILSALGAVVMYIISMICLFILRKKEPDMERPFKAPFYPVFPFIALLLSVICLIAIVYYNLWLSLLFFGIMIIGAILFKIFYKGKEDRNRLPLILLNFKYGISQHDTKYAICF